MTRTRRELTIEDIFQKQKYMNIWELIYLNRNKKIKFMHLRAALCRKPGLSTDKLPSILCFFCDDPEKSKEHIENLGKEYRKGNLSEDAFKNIVKSVQDDTKTTTLRIKPEDKFNSYQSLGNVLSRMKRKKLGLIDTSPDKKGHSYYFLTNRGFREFIRHQVHIEVDNLGSVDKLMGVHEYICDLSKN